MRLELNVRTIDILSALLILGVAALLVAIVIVITQRLERRSTAGRASEASERLAKSDEADDAWPGTVWTAMGRRARRESPLLIVDDAHTPSVGIVPWRAVAARDLSEVVGHRHPASHVWSERESDGLVRLFHVGFQLDELAAEADVEPCAVVEELARRAFGATDPVADPHARRFGQPWTDTELRTLRSASAAGLTVADTARQLGRDQLSTVFRILESAADARDGVSGAQRAEEASVGYAEFPAPPPARAPRIREAALQHG